ncbi:MAG: helix-turn-helix domain-containing protein [Bacteroidota bacterium]
MVEKFIERGTDYLLRNGTLSVYETNCACKDINFYFDQFVLTLMVDGHKTIETNSLKFEFFPGTFFIPQKEEVTRVSIPNATIDSPTKCLVLSLKPSFLEAFYEELLYSDADKDMLHSGTVDRPSPHYVSNDKLLIEAFIRLYDHQLSRRSPAKELIDDLIIKEMLLRIFPTEGLALLKRNFAKSIADRHIQKAIAHIGNHIQDRLTAEDLAQIAGLGQTTFFKRFKQYTGYSPIAYILHERIRQAKVMIQKNKMSLQEIAYKSGFNSYEYFCISFKKIENQKPTDYKKTILIT